MNNNNRVKELLSKLLEMFESGNLPPAVARTVIKRHRRGGNIPSDKWSLGNQLLMILQGTEDARGFKQWQEVGRSIKKGSKAIYILAPVTRKVTEKTIDPITNEEVDSEKTIIVGFRDIPVFRYEDTEGEPLLENLNYNPPQLPPLHEVAEHFGVSVLYAPFDGLRYGFYTWGGGRKIVLHTHDISVWFHELGHAVHNTFKPLQGGQNPEQEIVAELFAAAMCELHGVTGYHRHSWDYMKFYSGDDPAKTLRILLRILSDVEECFERVLAVTNIPALREAS